MLEIIDEMLLRGFRKEYLTKYLALRYDPTELADALITLRKNALESFAE